MAHELAKAYVQIVPSMRGAKSAISKEFTGIDSTLAAHSRRWGNTVKAPFKSAFKGLHVGGMAAVGAMSVAVGLFARDAIKASDATDKFKKTLEFAGLDSSQISRLAEESRQYADKTVYSLADIQNITAQLASNGVKDYDKLAQAAGNLNAVAGGNSDTFQSVGMVLTQTAGAGKLTTENWNQLANAIPGASGKIQAALLDAGAYTGNFRDAMAKGEISAEEFNQAILSLGFDKAAVDAATSAATIEGAWGNLSAAIVGGMSDALDTMKPVITGGMNSLADSITSISEVANTKLKTASAQVGEFSALLKAVKIAPGLSAQMGKEASGVIASVKKISDSGERVRSAFAGLGASISREFAPLKTITLDSLYSTIARIASISADLVAGFAQIGQSLTPIIGYAGQAASILGGGLLSGLETLLPSLINLGVALGSAGASFSSVLVPAAQAASAVIVPVAGVLGDLADVVAGLPAPILAAGVAFLTLRRNMQNEHFKNMSSSLMSVGNIATQVAGAPMTALGVGCLNVASGFKKAGAAIKAAFISNPVGIAITALTTVIGFFSTASGEAEEKQKELAQTLDQTTGAVTDQTAAFLANDEKIRGAASQYEALGGSSADFYAAIMHGGQALEKVNSILNEHKKTQSELALEQRQGITTSSQYSGSAANIAGVMNDTRQSLEDAEKATRDIAEATQAARDENEAQAKAIKNVIEATEALENKQRGAADAQFKARDAARQYNSALADFQQKTAAGGASADEMGKALDNLAKAGLDSVEANKQIGADTASLTTQMSQLRAQVISSAQAMGMSKAEAEAYANSIGLIPDSALTKAKLDTGEAVYQLGEFIVQVNNSSGSVKINGQDIPAKTTLAQLMGTVDASTGMVTIAGNKYQADMTLAQLLTQINASSGTASIGGDPTGAQAVLNSVVSEIQTKNPHMNIFATDQTGGVYEQIRRRFSAPLAVGISAVMMNANGNILKYARGGIAKFADGAENHVAQIAPAGAWRVWAEPETGGEAYIPLALSKRARSEKILAEVSDMFGMRLIPKSKASFYADGGGSWIPSRRGLSDGARVSLVVDGREFNAYVRETASELPEVRTIGELTANRARYFTELNI